MKPKKKNPFYGYFSSIQFFLALNQQTNNMYHDMGYPSHNYANYLTQFEPSGYGEPVHYMHHLSGVSVPTSTPTPPPPYNNQMHHQHLAMMQSHENRTWYQPPIAATSHTDHRYSTQYREKKYKQI